MKLAGRRIELEEIEHYLGRLSDDSKKLTAELIRPSGQDDYLCLAVFFTVPGVDGKSFGPETPYEVLPPLPQEASIIREALLSALPANTVPRYYIRLSRIPLTSTSKIDRQWLRKLGTTLTIERLSAYTGLEGGARQGEPPREVTGGEKKATLEAELRKLWA